MKDLDRLILYYRADNGPELLVRVKRLPLLETGGGVAMFDGALSGSWGGTTMARAWNGTRGTWKRMFI